MLALSIRQPWAWLHFHGKDVENRTKVQYFDRPFRCLVHASATTNKKEEADLAVQIRLTHGIDIPEDLPHGGIVGIVKYGPASRVHESRWHIPGYWGYPVLDCLTLPFTPWKGRLGFWEFPDDLYMRIINQTLQEQPAIADLIRRRWVQ